MKQLQPIPSHILNSIAEDLILDAIQEQPEDFISRFNVINTFSEYCKEDAQSAIDRLCKQGRIQEYYNTGYRQFMIREVR